MHSIRLMNVDMCDAIHLTPESRMGTVSFTLVSYAYTCRGFSSHIVLYMLWNVCAEYGILNLCSYLLCAVCGKSSMKGHCISTKHGEYEHSLLYVAVWFWLLHVTNFEDMVICWNLMKVPVTSEPSILLGHLLLFCSVCTKFFEGSVCFVFPGYCCREV